MAKSSYPPPTTPPSAPKHLRPELKALVRALAALPDGERSTVYEAVNEAGKSRGAMLTWEEWEAARGVVTLGGNALDDCDQLYDGA